MLPTLKYPDGGNLLKIITYVGYKTETHRHKQYAGYQREGGRERMKGKGSQVYGDRR